MTLSFPHESATGMTDPKSDSAEDVFIFPVSFPQERLWFLDQFQPDSPFYNIPASIRLGPLNMEVLERSLSEIIRRHEILRTTFGVVDGRPVQVIHPALPLELPTIDLRRLPARERESEVARLASEEALRPFDLTSGPLLRTLLVRRSEHDHLLLLTMHHIISDAWSMGIFFHEFSVLYEAYHQHKASPLEALPIQYADFAQWQRQWLSGPRLEQLLGYWREQLRGAPTVLELPTDHARPAIQSFRGATRLFKLEDEVTQQLKRLSQQEGVTLFMLLLGAFQVLLSRYTGQMDVVVGTPIANRNRGEIEGLIGFFVNTLVLRTDLGGEPSFRELMRRVREVTLGAYEHQDLPFERLVEELQPERNLNHNPLFQVMFSLQNNRSLASSSDSPQSTLEAMENSPKLGTAKFDLALFTEEVDQGLVAGFEYNTDLFEAATIERMVGHFQTLLESILADPDRPIVELPLLTDAERQQLLQEWNDTKTDYPEHACLPQLFEAQVEATPDAVAVLMAGRSWTYRELNGRANQVAHHLRKLGVSTDARVAICLERSLELVAGVLGILKAGGAYVPLDPAYPRERLAFILSDAQASVLLTEERLAGELPTEDVQEVVCLDSSWEVIARESTQNPASVATADNLAYIIYTSGSTGTPKGVGMIHRPLVNLLWWQIRNSRRASEARTLQFAPLSFDVSFQEMFSTWLAGGSLILMAEEERREMGKLLQGMAETEIERLFLPPVVLQQLAETLTDATPSTKLRQIITAGEQLQITEPVTRLFKRFNNCALYNHYGPSESHVVTEFALEGKPDDWPTFPPIGRPIANTRIYLLDAHLQPVPVGVHGELHIGGVALARGYHNRPILTAERFIPDPFSRTPGARLYKTGDRAQYRPDGNIEFLGRIDKQVKIRGFRIELGEIEAVLSRHPAVREAVAVSLTEKSGDKRLVAYLVADNGSILSTTQLYHFLKDQLPEYMIPSAFVQLDALPLTPNGKVNRRALPAPDRQRPELERAFVPPRTLVEQALAEIWSEVLRKEQVGVYDNFFELGGHSLLATQVVSRVREALQVELPLRRLFETPTVADLAVAVISSRAMQTNQEDLTQILAELEDLSEDEARTLLADEV